MEFGRAFILTAGSPGVKAGHSGSLLVRQRVNGDLIAAGIVAGGRRDIAFAFSIGDVVSELASAGILIE